MLLDGSLSSSSGPRYRTIISIGAGAAGAAPLKIQRSSTLTAEVGPRVEGDVYMMQVPTDRSGGRACVQAGGDATT